MKFFVDPFNKEGGVLDTDLTKDTVIALFCSLVLVNAIQTG